MLIDVRSAYDNSIEFTGTPKEVVSKYPINLTQVSKDIRKTQMPKLARDFYCRRHGEPPIKRTVIDLINEYNEVFDTVYSVTQLCEIYDKQWANTVDKLNRPLDKQHYPKYVKREI